MLAMRRELLWAVVAALYLGVASQAGAQELERGVAVVPSRTASSVAQDSLLSQFRVEAARFAAAQDTAAIPVPEADEEESWAKRHPVATGALTGFFIGGVLGALDSRPLVPPLVGFAIVGGMGAGIGTAVGVVVSAMRD